MLRTLAEKVNPKAAALIVQDVQNDFLHEDGVYAKSGLDISEGQNMIPRLAKLIDAARTAGVLTAFVQSWHNEFTESDVWQEQWSRRQISQPTCRADTWGANFYGIAPKPGELVVKKHRYSAFIGTDLDLILHSKDIQSLIIAGFGSGDNVESTVRDAFMFDYYTVSVRDCIATTYAKHQAAVGRFPGVVHTADEIINIWAQR